MAVPKRRMSRAKSAMRKSHWQRKAIDAARNAWNGHAHSILANQITMAIEAGSLFLDLSIGKQEESAVRFQQQVDESKPRDAGEQAPERVREEGRRGQGAYLENIESNH